MGDAKRSTLNESGSCHIWGSRLPVLNASTTTVPAGRAIPAIWIGSVLSRGIPPINAHADREDRGQCPWSFRLSRACCRSVDGSNRSMLQPPRSCPWHRRRSGSRRGLEAAR